MKKSQAALEFLYFVGAAMLILIIYLFISTNYTNITTTRKDNIAAQNLLEIVRNEINLAGRVENGYSKTYALPNAINNQAYTICIGLCSDTNPNTLRREIYIKFENNEYSKLLSTDVTLRGALAPSKNLLITKTNDMVNVKVL